MIRLVVPLLVLGLPVWAADWSLRPGEEPLSKAELEAFEGRTLTFYDNGQSRYSAEGAYSYTYAGGGTAFGTYRIAEDGSICTAFDHGFNRCDLFVHWGGRLILIDEKGERFPVRPEEGS
ncbi:hypothetical protein M3P21_13550 [Ruegeria sp. 2012CJ41-6]|uniref:Uncharacterized protein n=1 Tax=Ruegeria spongiae TaxID=2942209 RepID=A0ABT0Q407_9RHOB|nr:hypothetical protein [Ruegeria spongiae]MCL6284555.1 hypothetical protein [Ruegeria spongiae]